MLTRIITAVIGFILILPILIYSGTVIFNIFMSALSVIAVHEFLKCTGELKNKAVAVPTFIMAAIIPFAMRAGKLSGLSLDSVKLCVCVVIIYVFVSFALSVFSKGKNDITKASFSSLLSIYIVCGFSAIILIRDMADGAVFYPLIFVAAWSTDIFAYFGGMLFGKHKLIPDVSPKKTVEGAVGGIVGNVVCFLIYSMLFLDLVTTQYIFLIAMAPFASVISQIGDLLMSLVKRKFGIKDFGKLLPGHGGILDRFDSIIAVSLFLSIVCGVMSVI